MTRPASLTGAAHVRTNDARDTATVTVAARAWLVRRPGAPDSPPPGRFETGPYGRLRPLVGRRRACPWLDDKPPRYIFLPALPLERVSLISVRDIIA